MMMIMMVVTLAIPLFVYFWWWQSWEWFWRYNKWRWRSSEPFSKRWWWRWCDCWLLWWNYRAATCKRNLHQEQTSVRLSTSECYQHRKVLYTSPHSNRRYPIHPIPLTAPRCCIHLIWRFVLRPSSIVITSGWQPQTISESILTTNWLNCYSTSPESSSPPTPPPQPPPQPTPPPHGHHHGQVGDLRLLRGLRDCKGARWGEGDEEGGEGYQSDNNQFEQKIEHTGVKLLSNLSEFWTGEGGEETVAWDS